jgi:hypothetical protein
MLGLPGLPAVEVEEDVGEVVVRVESTRASRLTSNVTAHLQATLTTGINPNQQEVGCTL